MNLVTERLNNALQGVANKLILSRLAIFVNKCNFHFNISPCFVRQERIIRARFKDAYFVQNFGKNPYNIRILSRIFTLSCAKSAIFKIRRTLKPKFLDDFGAWRSPPSATWQE
jgi:hypothetical protein